MAGWSKDEWRRVDGLLAAALEVPVADRDAFLRASGETEEILSRVRRLLAVEVDAQARIGESAEPLASEVIQTDANQPAEEFPPGSEIGPYRVIRELGRGGMGTVYLAERSHDTYDRRVALKVIKRGMDTDEIVARFRREGRILARLEHPGIARMYDTDVTPDGRPFLVLEHVDGQAIDAHCDTGRLGVEERIRLFLSVCDAVSYAHGKLVLHRDLKPSNILVTADGPRLLDFGIGKLLDEDSDGTVDLTVVAGRRLTPEYASPEQLSGGEISTVSDVYALGVVLYELLTGVRPGADATRPPSAAVTDASDETTRSAASRGSTPQKLARRLHGDLDVILMKALHVDVERRYASVEAFAADLRRHLQGRPVTARPDSIGYRARKFVSRNRLPVLSGSGLGISILFFAIASTLQQAETARERDRAELERARVEQVAGVLEEMFTGAGFLSVDRVDTMRVGDFLDRTGREVVSELEDQPVVQGTLLRILGSAELGFGRLEAADSLLSQAVAVLEGAASEDPRPLLDAKRDLGHLRERQGRFDEARALYGAWLDVGIEIPSETRAELMHNIATIHLGTGQLDSAAVRLDSVIAIHRTRPDMDPLGFAASLTMRAGVAQQMGDRVLSLDRAREAVVIAERELGEDHPRLFPFEHNLAFTIHRTGGAEEAAATYADLLERYRDQIGQTPDLATLLQSYGNVLRELDRAEEALPLIEEAVAINQRILGPRNPAMAFTLDALGTVLVALERNEEALATFEEQLSIGEETLGPDNPGTAVARVSVAAAQCRIESAPLQVKLTRFAEAEAGIERVFPSGHPRSADFLLRKGRCLVQLERHDEARAALEAAAATFGALEGFGAQAEIARRLLAELDG